MGNDSTKINENIYFKCSQIITRNHVLKTKIYSYRNGKGYCYSSEKGNCKRAQEDEEVEPEI